LTHAHSGLVLAVNVLMLMRFWMEMLPGDDHILLRWARWVET